MSKQNASKNSMRGKRRVRKQSSKPSKAFVKKVQRIIHADTETKTVVFTSSATAFNQQINSAGDALRLMPQIANGTAENQKIGNVIRLQSLNVRGVLTFAYQTAAINTRIGVRLLVLRSKRFKDWNQAAIDLGTNYTRLLEGSTAGATGLVADFNTPINNDYFSVLKDKRFYMSQSNQTVGTTVNDTMNTTKFINFNVPYSRRKITYDQDFSANEPIDYPMFMCLFYCKLDGSAADLPATSYLTLQYVSTAKYEDA